ncbi:MAG: DUF3226 domain-containing protein, partial [Candidatus Desantisbacteria bacterium]
QIEGIQIMPIGGKQKIREGIAALIKQPNFFNILSLGIIRDGDDNPSGAFASVCSALENAMLPVPKAPLIIADGDLRVSVMILPDGKRCGALEDICLKSVEEDGAIPCVEKYFQCLAKKGIHVPTDKHSVAISKAKVHAFLASRKDPDKRLGEAAKANYWNLESPVFGLVKQFLQAL